MARGWRTALCWKRCQAWKRVCGRLAEYFPGTFALAGRPRIRAFAFAARSPRPKLPTGCRCSSAFSMKQTASIRFSRSFRKEERTGAKGEIVLVDVLYVGLGFAYYVSQDGMSAGYGVPARGGWNWTEQANLGPSIQRAGRLLPWSGGSGRGRPAPCSHYGYSKLVVETASLSNAYPFRVTLWKKFLSLGLLLALATSGLHAQSFQDAVRQAQQRYESARQTGAGGPNTRNFAGTSRDWPPIWMSWSKRLSACARMLRMPSVLWQGVDVEVSQLQQQLRQIREKQ